MTLAVSPSVAYHIIGPMDPYGSIPTPASPTPVEGPAPESSATGDNGEASVTDVCGERGLLGLRNGVLWRDGGRGVSAGAFCTHVVRHLPHPNSMSLPIASPHLLLHKTSSDHAMAAFQIQASVDFWQSAPP